MQLHQSAGREPRQGTGPNGAQSPQYNTVGKYRNLIGQNKM